MATVENAIDEIRDRGAGASQLRMLNELASRYRDLGLVDRDTGIPRVLSRECARCGTCWRSGTSERPATEYDAVALPWIGEHYDTERILVVGMNFDKYGGLLGHWEICGGHVGEMREGRRGHNGHPYAARSMSAVRAVRDSRTGDLAPGWEPPPNRDLAEEWSAVAYLQAIKCAPWRARSTPCAAMFRECPELLLMEELKILRPRFILLMGRSKLRDPVRTLLLSRADLVYGCSAGSMERDRLTLFGEYAEIVCLNHPSSWQHNWDASLEQLVASLADWPAT